MSVTNAHNNPAPAVTPGQVLPAPEILQPEAEQDKKLLHTIQAKLTVGSPDDPLEDEADAMADRVMRMPDTTFIQRKFNGFETIQRQTGDEEELQMKSSETFLQKKCAACDEEEKVQREMNEEEEPGETFLQRKCAACDEEEKVQREMNEEEEPGETFLQRKCAACDEEEKVQRKMDEEEEVQRKTTSFIQKKEDGAGVTSDAVTGGINASRGSGSAMDGSTKTFMESRFGADFSGVNIHTGSNAASLSRELNAKAFTVGNDIYFNEGQYNPSSDSGKHLLAHELTHTIQQGASERVQQKTGTPIAPRVQRFVPDDEKTLSTIDDEKIFNKNSANWEIYGLAAIMPLREITPDTAPVAYSNLTYRAQRILRKAGKTFNGKNVGVDGILGPETLIWLRFIAINDSQKTFRHQLAGLGFDMEAMASPQAASIDYQSRLAISKLSFIAEWNMSGPGRVVFEHWTAEDKPETIAWCDSIIFGGAAPQNLKDDGFTLNHRYALLKKIYESSTFTARAGMVTANRYFLDNKADNTALVKRDPAQNGGNPLRVSFKADDEGAALRMEEWFTIDYPGKKAKNARSVIGVREVDEATVVTGLLVSFYIPPIDATERARIDIIRQQYIDDWTKNMGEYIDAKIAAVIPILNDEDTSWYIIPGKLNNELTSFWNKPIVFEKFLDKLAAHPDKNYFELMVKRVRGWKHLDTLQTFVQLCNKTKYKDNALVKEAFEQLTKMKHSVQVHDYVTGTEDEQGVWINKERGEKSFLRIGDVTDGMYRITETRDRLKEAKRAKLEARMKELADQRIADRLSDNPVNKQEMDENKFMEAVLEQAAKDVGITEDDIEQVKYEEAFRIKGVTKKNLSGVDEFFIDYERVARAGGEGNKWEVTEPSGGPQSRETFETALGWYHFHNTMKATEKLVTYMAIGELVVVGGVFLLAGGGSALIALGGGAKMVTISISISVLLYVITADHLTIEGFLKAIVEGYLMAVGFRFLTPLGGNVAKWVGTATFRQKLVGIILRSVVTGGGSGAITSAGGMLVEDILRGKLRSPGDYLKGAAFGFLVGALFDLGGNLVLGPLFRTAGRNVLERIGNIQQLKEFFTINNIASKMKPGAWGGAIAESYAGFVAWVKENLDNKIASEILKDAKEKAKVMISEFADAFDANIHRQALELIDSGMTKESSLALDKLVADARARLGGKASRPVLDEVINSLVKDPKRVNAFLALTNTADKELMNKLLTGKTLNELATSDALLKVSAMREPQKMIDLLNLHFNQEVNTLESWARGLLNQADDAQLRILQLLETRGASVTPESLLRIAQSKSALTDDVVEGLTRMITEARGKSIAVTNIEKLLNNVADDKLQAFLIATGKMAKSDFDDIVALLGKPEQAGKLISYTKDAEQLLRILAAGNKNADEIAALFAATKGKGKFPDEIESLMGRFSGNTARVRKLVSQLDGDAALLERSIVRMNKADVEKVLDKAAAQASTQADAVSMRRFMLIAEKDAITDPNRLIKFLEAVQKSQTGAIPTNFATALNRLELMIANHPKTMLPFAQGSKTTLARAGAFHDISLTGGGTLRIEISEYDLYHYGKGHLTDKFSFDVKNLPPKRKKTTFWPPKTTIDAVYADAKAILADPKVKALVDAAGPNYRTDTITFGKFDYFVGIDMTEKRLVQFFPSGSRGGAIETSGDILAGVKAYFGL